MAEPKKRGPGRPKAPPGKKRDEAVMVRLSPGERAALARLARHWECSEPSAIRRCVRDRMLVAAYQEGLGIDDESEAKLNAAMGIDTDD